MPLSFEFSLLLLDLSSPCIVLLLGLMVFFFVLRWRSQNPTCALYGKMLLEKSMIDPNLILVLVADCNLINGTRHKASWGPLNECRSKLRQRHMHQRQRNQWVTNIKENRFQSPRFEPPMWKGSSIFRQQEWTTASEWCDSGHLKQSQWLSHLSGSFWGSLPLQNLSALAALEESTLRYDLVLWPLVTH